MDVKKKKQSSAQKQMYDTIKSIKGIKKIVVENKLTRDCYWGGHKPTVKDE